MKLMMDRKKYNKKPAGKEGGAISNRIVDQPVDITVEQLARNIVEGKTFTPAYFVKKNGVTKRQKAFWYSQQIIALDFDDGMTLEKAIEEFSESASFIYKTFSHTEQKHKFRVVFALNKPTYSIESIEGLLKRMLKMYPADKQCSDCTRLFYGGTEIIELDYNNRIKIDSFEDLNPEVFDGTKDGKLIYPAKNPKQQNIVKTPITTSNSNLAKNTAKNIELIKQRNMIELHRRINAEPKVVHNNFEMMNYLKQQDLRLYLGIKNRGSFIDIFHDEVNPSATIFSSNKNNGHHLYKCHSDSAPYVGTIFHLTQSLLNCTVSESRKFLMELYRIEIVENEVQKELRVEIDFYKELLQSEDLEELYPNFYKLFSRYGYLQDLYVLLDLVKEHLPAGDDPRLLFNHSIETIAKKLNRSPSATSARINFYSFFKLITKLESHEVPPQLLAIQQAGKQKKQHKYLNSTYELPLRDYDFFRELDAMSLIWIEKGCTINTVNYEGIQRNYGVIEADRVFPQDKGRSITPMGEDVTRVITQTALEFIEAYGYTTEQEVLENVTLYFKGQEKFKKKQFKICMGELIDGYDLERIRLNKQLKKDLKIEGQGFGYIIRKKHYMNNFEEAPISIENYEILD